MAGHRILLQGGTRDGEVHVLEQDTGRLEFRADEDEQTGRPDEGYLLTEEWRELTDGRSAQLARLE
ncbi:hypothetical protein [Lapillicoccus sp.]|uniref:hypothetical protein n=1 Tax=Lapillicoccus sp. TaxID=1909287 RepID=UPI00326350C3